MTESRQRRIVRWGLLVLAGCALISWLTMREPQVIRRSRAIQVGMSRSDAEVVLGRAEIVMKQRTQAGQTRTGLLFGLRSPFRDSMWEARRWLGMTNRPTVCPDDFPVLVLLDASDQVIRVKRGDQVKGANWAE